MTYIDPRDGRRYETVTLRDGNRWFAENLSFESDGSFPPDPSPGEEVLATNPGYDSKKYGRLYTWEVAQSSVPPGWHVPSSHEWERLFQAYGGFAQSIHDPAPETNDVPALVHDLDVEFGGCLRESASSMNATRLYYTYFGNFMGARFWSSSRPSILSGWEQHKYSGIYYLIRPNPPGGRVPRLAPSAHKSLEVRDYAFSVRCISD